MEILNQKKIILNRQDIITLANKELELHEVDKIDPTEVRFFISEDGGEPVLCSLSSITMVINKQGTLDCISK